MYCLLHGVQYFWTVPQFAQIWPFSCRIGLRAWYQRADFLTWKICNGLMLFDQSSIKRMTSACSGLIFSAFTMVHLPNLYLMQDCPRVVFSSCRGSSARSQCLWTASTWHYTSTAFHWVTGIPVRCWICCLMQLPIRWGKCWGGQASCCASVVYNFSTPPSPSWSLLSWAVLQCSASIPSQGCSTGRSAFLDGALHLHSWLNSSELKASVPCPLFLSPSPSNSH